mmetsp:Transcript_53489/g.141855  ORF Transcript_53489/g.141855 Transcript_53489/m.141855 type:complete len:84 (-) Transcript_53489:767-1018(-)
MNAHRLQLHRLQGSNSALVVDSPLEVADEDVFGVDALSQAVDSIEAGGIEGGENDSDKIFDIAAVLDRCGGDLDLLHDVMHRY